MNMNYDCLMRTMLTTILALLLGQRVFGAAKQTMAIAACI